MSDPIDGLRTEGGPDSDGAGLEIGSVVDRYSLVEWIGEGGFGVVYRAEQTSPVRRDVALKVTKLGMDTKEVIARFDAERQALAVLDHPNISKVFDAGSTDRGRPYFVMELVRGVPITEYCDTASLGIDARLALFQTVCQAVQHAHQKGIIHRDIKPTNVMVTVIDGEAIPKVIDFGIAKATDQRLTEKTLFTEQHQMVGTPEYMSPEQADISSVDIDTRADIYSLGVLLYELLTGSQPHDLKSLLKDGFGAVLAQIREVDPPSPSSRIRELTPDERKTASRQRRTTSAALERVVGGDLDWIVMKALEKDRARRYQTADALSQDLARYRRDEPVSARPPSAVYRLKKYVRRHRTGVVAATAASLALIIGAGMALRGYLEGERQLQRAVLAEAEAKQRTSEAELSRNVAIKRTSEAQGERDAKAVALSALEKTTKELEVADAGRQEAMTKLEASLGKRDAALKRARALGLINASIVAESDDPMRSLLLAREAVKLSNAPEVLSQLRNAIRNSPERARYQGHRETLTDLQVSPDGKSIVTTSTDYIARLWNMDGSQIDFFSHNGPVLSARFSPDGNRILTASGSRSGNDSEMMIWKTDGERVARIAGHKGHTYSAEYSPDGTLILTTGWMGTARLWDAEGNPKAELIASQAGVFGPLWAKFSADGTRVFTASDRDGTLRTWDLEGKRLSDVQINVGSGLQQHRILNFLGDDVLITDAQAPVRLVTMTGEAIATLDGPTDFVLAIAQSPDGSRIVTCSADAAVRLWDRTGKLLRTVSRHIGRIRAVAFAADGSRFATASEGGTALVHSRDGDIVHVVRGPVGPSSLVRFGSDGNELFVAGFSSEFKPVARRFVFDSRTRASQGRGALAERGPRAFWTDKGGRFFFPLPSGDAVLRDQDGHDLHTLRAEGAAIGWGTFSHNGQHLLTGSWSDATVRLWRTHDAKLLASVNAVGGHTFSSLLRTVPRTVGAAYGVRAVFCGDTEQFVTFSPFESKVTVWKFDGSQGVGILVPGALDLGFWPGKNLIALSGVDARVYLFQLNGTPVKQLGVSVVPDEITSTDLEARGQVIMAFAPEGQFLVSSAHFVTADVWSSDLSKLRTFRWRKTRFRHMLVSPDSKHVLAAMDNKCAYVWDLEGNPPVILQGHASMIESLAFSPEGDVVATGGQRTVRLWRRDGTLLDVLGGHTAAVTQVVFSPDGRFVYTVALDGTFRAFLRRHADVLTLADERVTRSFTADERQRYRALLGTKPK